MKFLLELHVITTIRNQTPFELNASSKYLSITFGSLIEYCQVFLNFEMLWTSFLLGFKHFPSLFGYVFY